MSNGSQYSFCKNTVGSGTGRRGVSMQAPASEKTPVSSSVHDFKQTYEIAQA